MKLTIHAVMICGAFILSGCGPQKNSSSSSMSAKYTLAVFDDINNPSTFDESTLGDIPSSVNLKSFMTPVKNQDERGTCSHFTAAALVESAIKKQMNVEVNLSEEYINYSTKKNGYFSQTEAGTALTNLYTAILDEKDFLLEKDWPYQPMWFGIVDKCNDFVVDDKNAPAECYSHNAPPADVMAKKISARDFDLFHMKNGTTNEIIIELATNKRPMSIAVPVNGRGWKNSGEIEYSEEMRQECIEMPKKCGSHEVVITGYDLEKKVFFFKNSWGKNWGDEGYGTFPIDMIDRHARHSSVLVELNKDIELPKDYARNPMELVNFSVSSLSPLSSSAVVVTTSGSVKNVGYHTLKIGTILTMKAKGVSGVIADNNAEFVELNLEDQAKYETEVITDAHVFLPETNVENFVLTGQKNAVLEINSGLMSTKTVSDLINDNRDMNFRTTLYMYSDDDGYKVLKRYYH